MKIKKYFYLGLVIVSLFSCDRYLETKVTNEYGDEFTWKLPAYAMATLLDAYNAINANVCGYNGYNYLDAVTDNSLTTQTGSTLYNYVFGAQTPRSDIINNWKTAYDNIAIANRFLEKGLSPDIIYDLNSPTNDQKYRNRSKGEAYFLRAWWQMELLRNYGGLAADGKALGYVIVTRTFAENELDAANAIPRSDFEACVQQILADCDTAFQYLPLQYSNADNNDPASGLDNLGRASGKAALALKSRVALLAASPAYQPKGSYALSADSIKGKWLRAAVIAQQAITNGQLGSLIALDNTMLQGANVNTPANANIYNEMLFRRTTSDNVPETNHYPAMWFGSAKCNPSQNLVNAYPMANGYPITDSRSGYNPQNPYVGRDARFARTINYNGSNFNAVATERVLQIYSTSADGKVGSDAPGYDYRNTWTGYYIRKGMATKANMLYNPDNPGTTQTEYHLNPLLRRAEVWMNLAEACNEYAGPNGTIAGISNTASGIIKSLRTAYGTNNNYVDEVATQGKDAFRTLILNERRIEFAFENMRLWDIRRCKLPLNEPILGIKIHKDVDNTYIYTGTNPGVDNLVVQTRSLNDDKYYTSPIPYEELIKNKNLVQNVGW